MTVLRRVFEHPAFAVVRVGAVVGAWVLWAWDPSLWWTVLVAALPLALQALGGVFPLRPVWVNGLLAAFMLSAGVGLWAAYDRDGSHAIVVFGTAVGWQKVWGLLLAVLLYWALASAKGEGARRWTLLLLTGLGLVVALVFLATNDWAAEESNWEPAARVGRAIQAPLPDLPRGVMNPNVTAGIIAPILPLSLGLAADAARRRAWLWAVLGAASAAVMVVATVLTLSRWTLISLTGAGVLTVLWWGVGRLGRRRQPWVFGGVVAAGALAGGLALFGIPALRETVLGSFTVTNRLSIFYQGALLARDYVFTGCGLGNFAVAHSTYSLMIHVPILPHSHLLLLNVVIEQGIVGALAAAAVWGGAGWLGLRTLVRREARAPFLGAGLVALFVLVAHGLADDGVYASRGVLLMWAPVGVIVACLPEDTLRMGRGGVWALGAVGVGVAVGGLLFGRPVAAAWNANLGAVAQSRVELARYDYEHFDRPTMDQIRREADLSVAEAYFERALALDAGQVTARTRLAQVALARGEYEAALAHAQAAWDAGHRDRVARFALGDALVAQGRYEEGADVVRDLDRAAGRLAFQAFYRYILGQDWQRAAWAWRAVAAVDPQSPDALQQAEWAEERVRN